MSDLLLLSGGVDSSAIAAWLRPSLCLTIDYGQLAAQAEITSSAQVCKELGLLHLIKKVDINQFGSGDMANREASAHSENSEFWPFRNQFLISLGAMVAMQHDCDRILIGTVVTDLRHKDGTEEFLRAMNKLLLLQEGKLRLLAPGIKLTSIELIQKSKISTGTLGWCHSCHTSNFACGQCRGCFKHSKIMGTLGCER
jgi:7-cyano-7-deazaguanine synthase